MRLGQILRGKYILFNAKYLVEVSYPNLPYLAQSCLNQAPCIFPAYNGLPWPPRQSKHKPNTPWLYFYTLFNLK